MAGKPLNRLELRRQNDAAEPLDPMEDEADDLVDETEDEDGAEKKPKKRAKAPAKAKTKAPKAVKPAARMRIVWVVMNDAFKQVGPSYEFANRAAAETRAAELTEKGKGTHFIQKVKEPMPDNAPGLGAAIPRPVEVPVAVVAPEAAAPVEDEDEIEDEDEAEEIEDEAEVEDEE